METNPLYIGVGLAVIFVIIIFGWLLGRIYSILKLVLRDPLFTLSIPALSVICSVIVIGIWKEGWSTIFVGLGTIFIVAVIYGLIVAAWVNTCLQIFGDT